MEFQSKVRVIKAISHQQPDRVPIDLRFSPELQSKLMNCLKMDEKMFWTWVGQDVVTVRPLFKYPVSPKKYADPTIQIDHNGYYLDIFHVPFQIISNPFQDYLEPVVDLPPLLEIDGADQLKSFPWSMKSALWKWDALTARTMTSATRWTRTTCAPWPTACHPMAASAWVLTGW